MTSFFWGISHFIVPTWGLIDVCYKFVSMQVHLWVGERFHMSMPG